MKSIHLFKTLLFSTALLLTAFAAQSFTKGDASKSSDPVSYYYTGNDMSEGAFANENNWSSQGSGGCIPGEDAPCRIEVPQNVTLGTHLNGLSNQEVLDISAEVKSAN